MSAARTDLLVVGGGLAGVAAGAFALQRGLDVALVTRSAGELPLSSGLLDFLGRYPLDSEDWLTDPWQGLAELRQKEPRHPYARVVDEELDLAWRGFEEFLAQAGIPYWGHERKNLLIPVPGGRLKATYRVPETMRAGVEACRANRPVVLVGLRGLKEFSARQMVAGLESVWPNLRTETIVMTPPGAGTKGSWDQIPLVWAKAMEAQRFRAELCARLAPVLGAAEAVGFPAILGLTNWREVVADMSARLGRPVFELPSLPPAAPGFRLHETFLKALQKRGARVSWGLRFKPCINHGGLLDGIEVCYEAITETIRARALLLASGRFLGGGLAADRQGGVCETLFGLPVSQPPNREDWHRISFLDRLGHPLNQAGLEVDDLFRPLGARSRPVHENLFAAGSILAHQDWTRQKCGAGLAIATAFAAVSRLHDWLG